MGYKIFVCSHCRIYCEVAGGMVSECCKSNVFIPNHNPKQIKRKTNPAI